MKRTFFRVLAWSATIACTRLNVADARGDTVQAYTYDSQGRLAQVRSGDRIVSYTYDYLGRVYSRSESGANTPDQYLYGGPRVLAEYDGNGNVQRRYLHGAGADHVLAFREGQTRYLHSDALNNVTLVTDASNRVLERVSYDSFGAPMFHDADFVPAETNASAAGNRHLFTGREWEPEVRLYNCRMRHYSPTTGRFVSPDPLGLTGGLNLYGYGWNNPVRFVDPFGTEACDSEQAMEDAAAVAAFQKYYNPNWNHEISFWLNPYGVLGPITIGDRETSSAAGPPPESTAGAHSHLAQLAWLEDEHGFGERDRTVLSMLWSESGGEVEHAYVVDGSTRKVLRLDALGSRVTEVGKIILPTIPENPSINNLPNWLASRYEAALSRSPSTSDESWKDVDRTQNAWTPWPESQTRSP